MCPMASSHLKHFWIVFELSSYDRILWIIRFCCSQESLKGEEYCPKGHCSRPTNSPPVTTPRNTKPFYRNYHWSFKISKHIAPVTDDIFGCHIFVTNFTLKIKHTLSEMFVSMGGWLRLPWGDWTDTFQVLWFLRQSYRPRTVYPVVRQSHPVTP